MEEKFLIRKATVLDVPKITELINGYANQKMMLNKSRYKVYTTLQNFNVAECQGEVCGCCALSILWGDLGEICSLAVEPSHLKRGIGSALVTACIAEAKKYKLPKLITLTYQDHFFQKQGFTFTDKNAFPRKLWRECLECPKLERCDESAYVLELSE